MQQVINDYGDANAETLTYAYDDRGYITQVAKDASNYSDYRYDGFGQLIRENYSWGGTSYTMVYNYDVGGNITSKVRYDFVAGDGDLGDPVDTIDYGYTDTVWKDKLTSFDGAAITYDEIGNPLTDGTWTYTWAQGRKLQQITNGTTTASYKYNDAGIRTEKTINGVTTTYNVVGGQVTWEKTGTDAAIYYSYDASGKLWAIQYGGSTYFYIRNGQGDITRLIDSAGDAVVEYAYDAWGQLLSTTGSLAATLGADNPYRYRGYRFDGETGLYYLQSRYYNPNWGRFVNADGIINGFGSAQGKNLFEYCLNNPVNMLDLNGFDPLWDAVGLFFLGAAVVAIGVVAVVAAAPVFVVAATAGFVATAVVYGGAVACGLVATTCGVNIMTEAVTGRNPLKEEIGERNFNDLTMIATMGSAMVIAEVLANKTPNYSFSTAKIQPSNIIEKLALEEVRQNPYGFNWRSMPNVVLNDVRWQAGLGWQKFQIEQVVSYGRIYIHFNFNDITGRFSDFKIVFIKMNGG